MTVPQQVNDYITRAEGAVCDSCIAHALEIRNGQARNTTLALATTRDFVSRLPGECSVCGQSKKVTARA